MIVGSSGFGLTLLCAGLFSSALTRLASVVSSDDDKWQEDTRRRPVQQFKDGKAAYGTRVQSCTITDSSACFEERRSLALGLTVTLLDVSKYAESISAHQEYGVNDGLFMQNLDEAVFWRGFHFSTFHLTTVSVDDAATLSILLIIPRLLRSTLTVPAKTFMQAVLLSADVSDTTLSS
jgi:hypothetical protein